jgi:eukaryotic-like serine/threonine-protein kinase
VNDRPSTLNDILAGQFIVKRDVGGGRYTLKREIGRGGAATVYLARDERHERFVAIKVLHPELSHAIGAQRFMREIKLTASLQHPHILPIHDSGEMADQLYYVMPYVEGESLRQRLAADNRLSIEEAVRIGREVAGALAYAHERGIVHRDIKPENILFSGGHAVVADFGIARAIDRASEKITQQGTITGTPAYMSPEQARDRAFDGRSDVYSLACVLYEAIGGVPPFPGDTPQQQLSARLTKTPALLREYRHDVPAPIESVIAKALATSPDDRYPDARTFSAALSSAIGNSGETLTARASRRGWGGRGWTVAAGVAVVLLVAAMSPPVRERIERLTTHVDSTQFAVVPFQYVGSAPPNPAADPAAGGVYESLKRWDGLALASDVSVQDAVRARGGDGTLPLDRVLRIARSVGAGRVVWGRVLAERDSSAVRVVLYDALTGASLREVTDTVPGRGADALRRLDYRHIVAELLRGQRVPVLSSTADRGTTSYAAWQAFQRGALLLARWQVEQAIPVLDSAVAADPSYPQANLWLAQAKSWRRLPVKEWTPAFIAADRRRTMLDAREQSLADALGAISRDDYPAACHGYATLRDRDTLDAIAWLGLATCQAYDRAVVPSPASPSGWAFRGSHEAAWRSITRALELAPEAFSALQSDFLRQIAHVEYNRIRVGVSGDSQFAAMAELRSDTIAYAPYPLRAATLQSADTYDAALRLNRDRVLALLQSLTQRMPGNADVFEAMTTILEARDEIIGTPNGRYSALSALERARALSSNPDQRLRLAAADVRLHLKLGDFAHSAATTDSVLQAEGDRDNRHASQLAALAAFAGRTSLATRYLRVSGPGILRQGVEVVPATDGALAALMVRTALGICDDSARTLPTSILQTLTSYVGASDRQHVAAALLERPLSLAVPCTGPRSTLIVSHPRGSLMRIQQVAARDDSAGVQRLLDSLAVSRRGMRPGGISLDFLIQEAWLAEFAGRPQAAAERLDVALGALPTLNSYIVTEYVLAASVGRAMAYRAELAARLNDPSTAALWASRVLTVWAHADPTLDPTLSRMRRLAAREPLS